MNDTIELINHLLAAALDEQPAGAPVRLRQAVAAESGLRLEGWVDLPAAQGEFRIGLEALPPESGPAGSQQTVRLKLEHLPERLPALVQALRPLLERARLQIEMEFPPPRA